MVTTKHPAAYPQTFRLTPDVTLPPQMSCLNADVVVLLFATDRPQTLARVSSYWMPELRRLHVTVPVVLVGTKSDLKPNDQHLQQVRQHC